MATRPITVNAIGFLEKDRRMIRNILSVASNKDYSYQLTMIGGEAADIVIVNTDDPVAMTAWNDYRQTSPDAHVILASAIPQFTTDYVCIKRPLIASQLPVSYTHLDVYKRQRRLFSASCTRICEAWLRPASSL